MSRLAPLAFRLVHEGRTYPLSPGINLIGRDPACVLCLDASSVSRRHAEVVVSDRGACLRDLQSKNGTFRGEARVKDSVPLVDGDEIRVGTVRVRFRAADTDSTATASSVSRRRGLLGVRSLHGGGAGEAGAISPRPPRADIRRTTGGVECHI